MRRGAEGIELDVYLSRDRVPMVIHKGELSEKVSPKSPTLTGAPPEDVKGFLVKHFTVKEIREHFRVGEKGSQIPKLTDVLHLVETENKRRLGTGLPPVVIDIELKDDHVALAKETSATIQQFLKSKRAITKEARIQTDTLIFNSSLCEHLEVVAKQLPEATIALNLNTKALFEDKFINSDYSVDVEATYRANLEARLRKIKKKIGIDAVDINLYDLRPDMFKILKRLKLGILTIGYDLRPEHDKLEAFLKLLQRGAEHLKLPVCFFKTDYGELYKEILNPQF
jgi:glycerophosphoryl diester phosphodiesterase